MARSHKRNTPGRRKVWELRQKLADVLVKEIEGQKIIEGSRCLDASFGVVSRLRNDPETISLDQLIEMCHHAGYYISIKVAKKNQEWRVLS